MDINIDIILCLINSKPYMIYTEKDIHKELERVVNSYIIEERYEYYCSSIDGMNHKVLAVYVDGSRKLISINDLCDINNVIRIEMSTKRKRNDNLLIWGKDAWKCK